MKIGELDFDTPIFLAPMAGVTDRAYRILAHEMDCPLCAAEMVSAQGIHYRNDKTLTMLETDPKERPISLQLFGRSPEMLAEAASFVENSHFADIIDFNLGCPAPKIVNNGEGSALMREPKLVFAIVRAMRCAVKLPLTVKMRKGWDLTQINAVEIAKICEAAGADALTVHGRTRQEFYSGKADWNIIAEVKRAVKIPVVANGDIGSFDDYDRATAATQADGVAIGRAAQGNPWIFRRLIHYARTGEKLPPPTFSERGEIMLKHLRLLLKFKGEYIGVREMRKHAAWYTRGLPHGTAWRNDINRAQTYDDFYKIVRKMLDAGEPIFAAPPD